MKFIDQNLVLRFSLGTQGYPPNCGMVQNLEKFDADFFGIPEKDAHFMDPQLKKLLEVSFEAIVDAGELSIFPHSLE